eukprot:1790623-Rhodomonas_salina.4
MAPQRGIWGGFLRSAALKVRFRRPKSPRQESKASWSRSRSRSSVSCLSCLRMQSMCSCAEDRTDCQSADEPATSGPPGRLLGAQLLSRGCQSEKQPGRAQLIVDEIENRVDDAGHCDQEGAWGPVRCVASRCRRHQQTPPWLQVGAPAEPRDWNWGQLP